MKARSKERQGKQRLLASGGHSLGQDPSVVSTAFLVTNNPFRLQHPDPGNPKRRGSDATVRNARVPVVPGAGRAGAGAGQGAD